MSTVQVEQVMVIPTELFRSCGYFQGFCKDTEAYLGKLLDPTQTKYLPRDKMEQDPSYKQLIPYCIFQYTDPQGGMHLFQYTRGKGQGEARLHSKRSIGIGGHISSLDATEIITVPGRECGENSTKKSALIVNTPNRVLAY